MWVARGLLLVLCTLVIARSAPARVEGMRWRAPEPSGEGAQSFRIYYGTRTRDYAHVIDLGNPPPGPDGVRSHDLVVPDADPIYVAMTSYDEGGESGYSNEVFRDGIRLPRLLDVTAAAGLADPEDGGEAPPQELPVDMAGGAAAGDYDGDGWVDLYVTRWGRADRLFRNRGDGTFEDRTLAAGLGTLLPSTGAGWGDVDNDGDLDLYVTTAGPGALRFHLYLNDGAGRFEEDAVARGAAVLGPEVRYGQSVAFGDFDLDGWLDLHTTEWWPGDAGAAPGSSSARLLRNRGAAAPGFFEDVTDRLGVSLGSPSGAAALSSRFSDLDGDGAPDLLVVGDGGTSRLFWNEGGATFVDGTASAGVGTDENGTGGAVGDFDGDGQLDWFVTGIHHPGDPCAEPGAACAFGASGNRLYRGIGERRFLDVTDAVGVREGFWGTGAVLADLDNDGRLDAAMTNGRLPASDAEAAGEAFRHFEADPVRVWLQGPTGVAEERAVSLGAADTGVGRGMLRFDYDRDGDLDLLIVNHPGEPALYRNDLPAGNDWLRVRGVGTDSNRGAIGAVVRVWASGESSPRLGELGGGSSYLAQSEAVLHFGLGRRPSPIERVEVHWPATGRTRVLLGVAPNQEITVVEPAAEETEEGPEELPVPPEVAPKSGGRPACGLLGIEPWLLGLYHAFRRRRATGGR